MSRCPWLAARCRGVSSPRFMTLIRAPLMISMSTTLERPSLQAQWRGLKPWSSLQRERNIYIQHMFYKKKTLSTTRTLNNCRTGMKSYTSMTRKPLSYQHPHVFSPAKILWYNWNKAKWYRLGLFMNRCLIFPQQPSPHQKKQKRQSGFQRNIVWSVRRTSL